MTRNKKPKVCSDCGSKKIAKIVYGLPHFSEKERQQVEAGKIVFGGCVVSEDDPDWQCVDCGQWFPEPRQVLPDDRANAGYTGGYQVSPRELMRTADNLLRQPDSPAAQHRDPTNSFAKPHGGGAMSREVQLQLTQVGSSGASF